MNSAERELFSFDPSNLRRIMPAEGVYFSKRYLEALHLFQVGGLLFTPRIFTVLILSN
jgi:hypothetical protein